LRKAAFFKKEETNQLFKKEETNQLLIYSKLSMIRQSNVSFRKLATLTDKFFF
jgi:hypothetical protein